MGKFNVYAKMGRKKLCSFWLKLYLNVLYHTWVKENKKDVKDWVQKKKKRT